MLRQAGERNFDSAPCILAEEGKKTEAEMKRYRGEREKEAILDPCYSELQFNREQSLLPDARLPGPKHY